MEQLYTSAYKYNVTDILDFTRGSNVTTLNYPVTIPSDGYTRDRKLLLAYIQTLIGVIGLSGNAAVIYVIYRHTKLYKQAMAKYVINQSIVDGVCSLMLLVTTWVNTRDTPSVPRGVLADLYCDLWGTQFLLWATTLTSAYNLVFISLERLAAVRFPLWYRRMVGNESLTNGTIVTCWLFGYTYTYFVDMPRTYVDSNGLPMRDQHCQYMCV